MDQNHISKAVLLAMDLNHTILDTKKYRQSLEEKLSYTYIFDIESIIESMRYILQNGHTPNNYVHELVKSYPNRFIGFGSVNLGYQSKSYVQKKLLEIEEYDFKGIKLLPTLQFYNPSTNKMLVMVFKFAEKNEKIILFHTGCDPGPWEFPTLSSDGNPLLLKPLIQRYSKVQVVIAHLGSYSAKAPGIWLDEALSLAKNFSNVWGDLAAVPYLVEKEVYVKKIKNKMKGFDHILYGSDFPVVGGWSSAFSESIPRIMATPLLDDNEKEAIMGLNALKLLQLDSIN